MAAHAIWPVFVQVNGRAKMAENEGAADPAPIFFLVASIEIRFHKDFGSKLCSFSCNIVNVCSSFSAETRQTDMKTKKGRRRLLEVCCRAVKANFCLRSSMHSRVEKGQHH